MIFLINLQSHYFTEPFIHCIVTNTIQISFLPSMQVIFITVTTADDKMSKMSKFTQIKTRSFSYQLLPFFKLLRILGRFPVSFETSIQHLNLDSEQFKISDLVVYKHIFRHDRKFAALSILWTMLLSFFAIFGLHQFGNAYEMPGKM